MGTAFDGFSATEEAMLAVALLALQGVGYDTDLLQVLIRADMPAGYRGMSLDDGAVLGAEAFQSQDWLNHVLEEEFLHLRQKQQGLWTPSHEGPRWNWRVPSMSKDDSQRRAEVQARLVLLKAASEGQLDELSCPQCARDSVSVSFTRPTATEYHTWFVCSECGFSLRAQNSGVPAFYSEERDRTGQQPSLAAESHSR